MSKKFNFSEVVEGIRANLKNDQRVDQIKLGSDLTGLSDNPEDYVVMPDWWAESFGFMGMPIGKIVQIAGSSDSGKSSLAITAMKAAQEQGFGVIYVETELKTSPEDLKAWGIDPDGILIVQTPVAEEAFDGTHQAIKAFFEAYPDDKLFLAFDSYGNTVSTRDSELDMTTANSQPGAAAKVNRVGINRLIAYMAKKPIAALIVNYVYDQIGMGHGKVNAGGNALNFFSYLTLQSARVAWIEAQVKGVKIRKGAKVKWSVYKNHACKSAVDPNGEPRLLPKAIQLEITAEGMKKLKD